MALKNVTVWVDGKAWKVKEARSLKDAQYAIAMARCTGSTFITFREFETVVAEVEKVNLNACNS